MRHLINMFKMRRKQLLSKMQPISKKIKRNNFETHHIIGYGLQAYKVSLIKVILFCTQDSVYKYYSKIITCRVQEIGKQGLLELKYGIQFYVTAYAHTFVDMTTHERQKSSIVQTKNRYLITVENKQLFVRICTINPFYINKSSVLYYRIGLIVDIRCMIKKII